MLNANSHPRQIVIHVNHPQVDPRDAESPRKHGLVNVSTLKHPSVREIRIGPKAPPLHNDSRRAAAPSQRVGFRISGFGLLPSGPISTNILFMNNDACAASIWNLKF